MDDYQTAGLKLRSRNASTRRLYRLGSFHKYCRLVNELVEAKYQLQLRRVLARWSRYDLIAIDEMGCVRLAEVGAEFLFQVVSEALRTPSQMP
jgi:DNA replication protein DnaC